MSFRHRSKPGNPSKIVLPITPMLDMTFQLLFFFIVNFRPAPATVEGQLEMALPTETTTANPNKPNEKPQGTDKDLDFPSDLTVKVRTQLDGTNDGAISALAIRSLDGKETPVDGGLDGLQKRLAAMREDGAVQQKSNIKVQGDGKLKVRALMEVMDACRLAGFSNVSMVPPEDFVR